MRDSWRRGGAAAMGCFMFTAVAQAAAGPDDDALCQLVAVSIVGDGRAIVLATPGLRTSGRTWRFRSFDTSDLPQPIRSVSLSTSGTKLFIQAGDGPGGVLDLTRQYRQHAPLQIVRGSDLAADGLAAPDSHRLPAQRFVSVHHGQAFVIDDTGRVLPEYPVMTAVRASITADGVALYAQADGTLSVCGDEAADRASCRALSQRIALQHFDIAALAVPAWDRSASRFAVIAGTDGRVTIVDPESSSEADGHATGRTEASLRACLKLHRLSVPDERLTASVHALVQESARTWAAPGGPIAEWTFFRVAVDADLYAPVLELARLETVFPAKFDTLERLAAGLVPRHGEALVDLLYDRYLRLGAATGRAHCNYYVTTHSTAGSWILEYWLYYPFDVGGLGSHPHDPEHVFVEVDKLGGDVRRVIGAGHGYIAGNNMFTAGRDGAQPVRLPLFAIVELGKHASAPDIDGDGVFTPGIDENTYNERAKVWGVRDVIGTMNNELLAYDTTMSGVRRASDFLAPSVFAQRFPGNAPVVAAASCELTTLPGPPAGSDRQLRTSDWILLAPCDKLTSDCARLHVTAHPDFLDLRTIQKEWSFPSAFLRTSYSLGPHRGLHSISLGYAMDMDLVPGLKHALPLPGRLGVDVFYWHQPTSTLSSGAPTQREDRDSCPGKTVIDGIPFCPDAKGAGWAVRYEQFLSNLFGIYSSVRVFSPPLDDAWITFGPFMEAPIGRRSNAMVLGGLAFRPYESPRFEMKVSIGLWKPKTNHAGISAANDNAR
jgi:hypothetical protein